MTGIVSKCTQPRWRISYTAWFASFYESRRDCLQSQAMLRNIIISHDHGQPFNTFVNKHHYHCLDYSKFTIELVLYFFALTRGSQAGFDVCGRHFLRAWTCLL